MREGNGEGGRGKGKDDAPGGATRRRGEMSEAGPGRGEGLAGGGLGPGGSTCLGPSPAERNLSMSWRMIANRA